MLYNTDKKVKSSIDGLLKQNARNVSNFMTKSKYDLKTVKAMDDAWDEIENKIKSLDEAFYKVIRNQDD